MNRLAISGAAALPLVLSSALLACLWDSDTLQMERLRFPGALEIITGKFVRHSRAYYEWRITDRLAKLASSPDDPALIDDLAVAYAKLGRPEEGIAILEQSLAKQPDRYETLSNLGTLHFFAGNLDISKDYIRRALAINPNAHFGREKYQLLLTEYVQQSQRVEIGVLSSEYRTPSEEDVILVGFADFVLRHSEAGRDDFPERLTAAQREEIRAAVRGVLGMLHFADHTSPILLECLGDLLLTGRLSDDAAQHAARAYLRAAEFAPHPDAAARLRVMAKESLSVQEKVYFTPLRESLAAEVAAADQWFAKINASEAQWIREGKDVDREFAAVYYQTLEQIMTTSMAESGQPAKPSWYDTFRGQADRGQYFSLAFAFILAPLFAFAATFLGVYWLRIRRRAATSGTKPSPVKNAKRDSSHGA